MLQALIAGMFVSHDLISFITFLLLTTFCILCLIRIVSGARSQIVFESTMYLQFLGDALIIGGLLLAAVAYSWMQSLLLEAPQAVTFQFHDLLQGTASDIMRYSLAATYWSHRFSLDFSATTGWICYQRGSVSCAFWINTVVDVHFSPPQFKA